MGHQKMPNDESKWVFENISYLGSHPLQVHDFDKQKYHEIMSNFVSARDCSTQVIITLSFSNSQAECAITYAATNEVFQDFKLDQIHKFYRHQTSFPRFVTLHYFENKHGQSNEATDGKCLCFEFNSSHSADRFIQMIKTIFHIVIGNPFSNDSLKPRIFYNFYFLLEIQELYNDKWQGVPKTKSGFFKIRSNVDRRLLIGIRSVNDEVPQPVKVRRCLGAFICYGRYRKMNEMTSLEIDSCDHDLAASQSIMPGSEFATTANWSHKDPDLQKFNLVNDKNESIFFTISVTLLFESVSEPVTFQIVGRAKVHRPDENFWLTGDKRPLAVPVCISLHDIVTENQSVLVDNFSLNDMSFPQPCLSNPTTATFSLGILNVLEGVDAEFSPVTSPEDASPTVERPLPNEDSHSIVSSYSNGEEHVASGQGFVARDIDSDELLTAWSQLIKDWQNALMEHESLSKIQVEAKKQTVLTKVALTLATVHPLTQGPYLDYLSYKLVRRVRDLVGRGVPESIRTEVWFLLTGSDSEHKKKMEAYRILLPKYCEHDSIILKDLGRTYPAHDYFQSKKGQDALFQVNHAYAIYDEEIGYYQSTSFIAAALLLHIPEEQAFSLLVDVMFRYNHRSLFLHNFQGLHLMLYQLEYLLKQNLPSLARHFADLRIESHMYASQWIMTLFTSKFPLHLVFKVLDLFFLEGRVFIFKIFLALMETSENDLKGLDFEGVLRFFSCTLPRRYLDNQLADELIKIACNTRVSLSKLTKIEKRWHEAQQSLQANGGDPIKLLLQEKELLMIKVNQLERENESLARNFIDRQVALNSEIEELDRKSISQASEVQVLKQEVADKNEENSQFKTEICKLKEMLRESTEENTILREQRTKIFAESREICHNLASALKGTGSGPDTIPACLIPGALLEQITEHEIMHGALDKYVPDWKVRHVHDQKDRFVSKGPLEENQDVEMSLALTKLTLAEMQTSQAEIINECVQLRKHNEFLQQQILRLNTENNNGNETGAQKTGGWLQRTFTWKAGND